MLKKFKKSKKPFKNCKEKRKTFKEYSSRCKFKFDVYEFPNEFNLKELERIGWYNADNPNGMSRDHMVSISYGWKHDIDPRIIRHPANCELLTYNKNHDKSWRSSISLRELIQKIKKWTVKYKGKKNDTSFSFK